ncbi:MAG: tetratricopeptide repeat protein, partial [Candidatus Methylomirabilia bacterium]
NLLGFPGVALPALGSAAENPLTPAAPDEAPSIRQRQEREDALSANLSQGDYYYYNGNWGKALPYYLRVMEMDARQVSLLARVAQIYELLNDPAKARVTWERVLTQQADNAEARKHLQKLGR